MESVCLVLAFTTNEGWEVHHMDLKTTFLNGQLAEEVYVCSCKGLSSTEQSTSSFVSGELSTNCVKLLGRGTRTWTVTCVSLASARASMSTPSIVEEATMLLRRRGARDPGRRQCLGWSLYGIRRERQGVDLAG
jgi:hypothetical protein